MPNPNQRVGEFILDARIGGGTFGQVWRAHHHVWVDQLVAVKIPTDSQYIRNLQREGAAIHGLVHPNIVRATGFDPFAETPYLTMEYIPGTSLRPLISERRLGIPDAVAVMKQVLAGLAHAHANGIVHRDVKPENVLVHEKALVEGFATPGLIKVTDFGLGKAATKAAMGSIAYSAEVDGAAAAEIAGTLDYMAPEQRGGNVNVDARADLYACGVMLYELLTGEKPAGTDLPSESNKGVPKWLDEAFRRSYARVDKRFASAEEFIAALNVGGGQVPGRLPSASRPVVTMDRSCPQCRTKVQTDDQFCMQCGVQLVPTVRRCGRCGAHPDGSDQFCMFCGENLSPKAMARV